MSDEVKVGDRFECLGGYGSRVGLVGTVEDVGLMVKLRWSDGESGSFLPDSLHTLKLFRRLPREDAAPKPPALHGQALVDRVEKRDPAARPCPTHNMPLPCVECGLNARYAQERGRVNLDAMYVESVLAKRAAEQQRASLPVIRPWAMMDGVQGPGWNRRVPK